MAVKAKHTVRRRKKDASVVAAQRTKMERERRAAGFSTDHEWTSRMSVPSNYAGPPRDYSLRLDGH